MEYNGKHAGAPLLSCTCLQTVANRFLARRLEVVDAPTPPVPGLYLLKMYVDELQVTPPPGFIFVLRRPATPTFFLYKNPGNPVLFPYQNWPLENPDPKADIFCLINVFFSFLSPKILFCFYARGTVVTVTPEVGGLLSLFEGLGTMMFGD